MNNDAGLLWTEVTFIACCRSALAFKYQVYVIIFPLGAIAICAVWDVPYILSVSKVLSQAF